MLRRGVMGSPAQTPAQSLLKVQSKLCFNPLEGESPSPSGRTEELPRGVWMRPLGLQTRAVRPPSPAQHGEVCRCLRCKLVVVGAPGGGEDIQKTPMQRGRYWLLPHLPPQKTSI